METEKHTVQQTMEHELSQTEAAQLQLRDELIQLQHDIEVPPYGYIALLSSAHSLSSRVLRFGNRSLRWPILHCRHHAAESVSTHSAAGLCLPALGVCWDVGIPGRYRRRLR